MATFTYIDSQNTMIKVVFDSGDVAFVPANSTMLEALIARLTSEGGSAPTVDAYQAPPADAMLIRMEAQRRIAARYQQWELLFMVMRAIVLIRKGQANWTPAEITEMQGYATIMAWVKAVKDAGDALQVSLPADYAADARWPA